MLITDLTHGNLVRETLKCQTAKIATTHTSYAYWLHIEVTQVQGIIDHPALIPIETNSMVHTYMFDITYLNLNKQTNLNA